MSARDSIRTLYDAHGEKLRFLLVGMWTTLVSIVLYNLVLTATEPFAQSLTASSTSWVAWLGDHLYIVVFWLVWVIAVVHSTATMKYFAFRSPGPFWRQVPKAYLIYLPAQGLSTAVLWATVQLLHLSPRVGQILAIFISTVFSYLGHKYFTFRAPVEVDEALEAAEGETRPAP
jgi:putative flippase GtrA